MYILPSARKYDVFFSSSTKCSIKHTRIDCDAVNYVYYCYCADMMNDLLKCHVLVKQENVVIVGLILWFWKSLCFETTLFEVYVYV